MSRNANEVKVDSLGKMMSEIATNTTYNPRVCGYERRRIGRGWIIDVG